MPEQRNAARVALVAPFGLRPKGTTVARVLPIGRVLAGLGAAVQVIVPPWDDRGRAGDCWQQDGLQIVHTRAPGGPFEAGVILSDLARRVADFRPDVVHAFKPIGYSGAIAFWLAIRGADHRGPRLIVDTDDLEGPAGWAGRRKLGLSGWVRGQQELRVLRTVSRVTVASQWLAEYAMKLGHPSTHVFYLPNGHNETPEGAAEVYGAQASSNGGGGVSLLWYTRFTETTTNRAASLFVPLLRDDEALRLAVIGEEIAEGARAALGAAFTAGDVAYQIDWLGYQPQGIERYLARHSGRVVAVYPMDDDAVNRARCPSKVPQLMALGVPIVAEAVGEVARYLAGFEDPCLVTPNDMLAFRSKVRALASEGQLRRSLADRLRIAAERWTWKSTAAHLLNWYLGAPDDSTHS